MKGRAAELFAFQPSPFRLSDMMKSKIVNRVFLLLALLVLGGANLIVPAQTLAPPYESSVASYVKTASEAVKRGEELRRKWELDGAAAVFREALSVDPKNLEAALGLAKIARVRFDYKESLRLLDRAAPRHADSADLLAEYGAVYLTAEEPERALKYIDRALKLDKSHAAAITGRAAADLLQRDYKSAEDRLRKCISLHPQYSSAHTLLARVHLEKNENDEAANAARLALELNPYNTDALYLLAFARAAQRKPGEVKPLVKRALALDPLNSNARRLLSQYSNGRAGYEQKISEEGQKHYERGRTLKQQGRFAEAVSEFEAALRVEPRYYRALIALGDIWLREGDYERAAMAARLAIEIDPDGALAHLELSYASWGMQERARIEIGATDFAAQYFKQAAPPAFDLASEIFPNYESLTARQRIMIDKSIAPLAHFLQELARKGARHYLLPFDQSASEIEELNSIARAKTVDGRYYSSLRGVGGRITVSGLEYIDLAIRGGYNAIAHEFAHQVHMTALSREESETIRRLYKRAKSENRALDYYAAENEYEYFAQGYEAFISEQKRPAAGVTARHTKRELLTRDPELYRFFEILTRERAR